MKLQSYHYSTVGNAYLIADTLATEYKLKADQIPPAYQPNREFVVFISFDSGTPETKLLKFCSTLEPSKTHNVALCICGPDEKGLDEVKKAIEATGVNVHPNVYKCQVKKGLIKTAKITEEQRKGSIAWAQSVIDDLSAK